MDDIIDIYEPIYRETSNLNTVLIILLSAVVLGFIIFFILKKLRKKERVITPQESYKNTLDRYLEIQNSIETLTTNQFSLQVSSIFKSYLSTLYSVDFLSSTNQEMLIKLERIFNFNNGDLVNFFLNELEPGQFGKYQIPKDKKNQIIKTCVDVITELYNKKTGVEND